MRIIIFLRHLYSALAIVVICLWQLSTPVQAQSYGVLHCSSSTAKAHVKSLVWAADNKTLAVAITKTQQTPLALNQDPNSWAEVQLWDTRARRRQRRIQVDDSSRFGDIALSPDGRTVGVYCYTSAFWWGIQLWDLQRAKRQHGIGGATGVFQFTSDNRKIIDGDVTESMDTLEVMTWTRQSGRLLKSIQLVAPSPCSFICNSSAPSGNPPPQWTLSPDGRFGAIVLFKAEHPLDYHIVGVLLFDTNTGKHIRILSGHSAFFVNERIVGTFSRDKDKQSFVRLWDIQSGQLKASVNLSRACGPDLTDSFIVFSPDLTFYATTGSGNKTIRVWNYRTKQFREFKGHLEHVTDLAFSPNSKILASGSEDGTIRLWHIQ